MKAQSKFTIKPGSFSKTALNEGAIAGIWSNLSQAIDQIYDRNASSLSFEELYRNAYTMVLNKKGQMLYEGVKEKIKIRLSVVCNMLTNMNNNTILSTLAKEWGLHCVSLAMIRDILMYMDRMYSAQQKLPTIYTVGQQLFRDVVVFSPSIREKLRTTLLQSILAERTGEIIDRVELKAVLNMLEDLNVDGCNVYMQEFEQPFIEMTRNFYRDESQIFLQQNTCSVYLQKVQRRLVEEEGRLNAYLSSTTELKLKSAVDAELIAKHATILVEMESSGCEHMLNETKIEDLSLLYTILSRVPSTLDILRDFVFEHVRRLGQVIIADQDAVRDPVNFVQKVLDLKSKFDSIITQSFRAEKKMQKRLKDAFEDFLNKDSRAAAYLAYYVDEMFKTGLREKTQAEAESFMDHIVIIFRHILNKDVFEEFYRNHFAKRLLAGSSVSDEVEELMIKKLKNECGYQFVSKLDGMVHDIRNSKTTMEEYKKTEYFTACGIDFRVEVLTMGYWSSQAEQIQTLHPQLTRCCESFTEFFNIRHRGQKLMWQSQLGTGEIKATFPSGSKDLTVTTYQMCFLMLFNNADVLSLNEIRDACGGIPETDLRRHLLSLCTSKVKVLTKKSKDKVKSFPKLTLL